MKNIRCFCDVVERYNPFHPRYDLAELYLKLKNYEKAEKVIRQAINFAVKSGERPFQKDPILSPRRATLYLHAHLSRQ